MQNKYFVTLNFIKSHHKREHEIHANNLLKIYTKKPGEQISKFQKDFDYAQGIKYLRTKKRKKEVKMSNKRINRQNKVLLSRIKNIEKRDGKAPVTPAKYYLESYYKMGHKDSAFHRKTKSIGSKFKEDRIKRENRLMVERLLNV